MVWKILHFTAVILSNLHFTSEKHIKVKINCTDVCLYMEFDTFKASKVNLNPVKV